MGINFKEFPDAYAETLEKLWNDTLLSKNELERSLNAYFWIYAEAAKEKKSFVFGETLEIIGILSENPDYFIESSRSNLSGNELYRTRLPAMALAWGMKFFKQFLKEIRKILCNKKKGKVTFKEYKDIPKALIASLATSLMATLHITNPVAIGMATLIILIIATATKKALCTMTDEEVLKEIEISSIDSTNFPEYMENKKRKKNK